MHFLSEWERFTMLVLVSCKTTVGKICCIGIGDLWSENVQALGCCII